MNFIKTLKRMSLNVYKYTQSIYPIYEKTY